MKRRSLLASTGFAAVTVAVAMGSSGAATPAVAAAPTWTFRAVISHLNEPRGLSFDGRGNLYVAQSGRPGPGTLGVTHTGAVSKYRWARGALARAWYTPFASLYVPAEGGGPGSEVLGPAAVSAVGRGCSTHADRAHRGSLCEVRAIEGESRRGVKAATGLDVPQLGHLFRLNGRTGAKRAISDIGGHDYAFTSRHVNLFPDDFPDANPFAVLTIRGSRGHHHGRTRTFVADAGANTISEVFRNGKSRIISYIPNETAGAKRDATPTCIAQGPDGALYVGTLDLLSNFAVGPGQSNVWRVNPNSTHWRHNAKLWATGFTTIDGCAFDRSGRFWASELFFPNKSGPPGDLARISFRHPGAITHIGGGSLPLPGGIAQGPDGAMYVSTGVADTTPRSGAVVRVARH
jgi:hypothetical protein